MIQLDVPRSKVRCLRVIQSKVLVFLFKIAQFALNLLIINVFSRSMHFFISSFTEKVALVSN